METILAPPRRRPRRCCSTTTTILHVAHAIIETILAPPRLHPRRRRRRRCSSTHGSTATMCRLAHRCSYRLEGVCKIQSPKDTEPKRLILEMGVKSRLLTPIL